MTKAQLEKYIKNKIYPNNAQEITAEVLQDTLLSIVATLLSNEEVAKLIAQFASTLQIVSNGNNAQIKGASNSVTGKSSLLVATNVDSDADYSIIGGAGHIISGNNRVAVFGTKNTVINASSNSIIAGNSNYVDGSSNSIVAGTGNTTKSDSDRSIIAGKDNAALGMDCIIAGVSNTARATGAIVAGVGANAGDNTYLAIGQGVGKTHLFEVNSSGVYFKGVKIA